MRISSLDAGLRMLEPDEGLQLLGFWGIDLRGLTGLDFLE